MLLPKKSPVSCWKLTKIRRARPDRPTPNTSRSIHEPINGSAV